MIANLFPPNQSNIPIKKFRGKKRCFRKIIRNAKGFSLSVNQEDWYDMGHYHMDWEGYGNITWKVRLKHIEALCLIYKECANVLEAYPKPYQLWIYLNQKDSGQDAVFIHTPNPDHDNFPCKMTESQ